MDIGYWWWQSASISLVWWFALELGSPDCDPSVILMHFDNTKVLENEWMKSSSSTSVAQILQNYFIRLLFWNFFLSKVLMTLLCLFTFRSVQ
jgi:hypothetical protein